MKRDQLISFLDDYLQSDDRDYCPNGLQVEGRDEIRRVVTAVSSCLELFERAAAQDADAILVHHGIFWNGTSSRLTGMQGRRVRALMTHGLNLIAYHLPLDRHSEVGNNALAARSFGLEDLEPFGEAKGAPVGYRGRFPTPIPAAELAQRCAAIYRQEPLVFDHGPATVSTLGIISGGAQSEFYTAIDLGLDAYITGEVSEWVMNVAKETQTHYLAAGHYATERLGVRRLGELLHERFGLEVEFIDLPNPV